MSRRYRDGVGGLPTSQIDLLWIFLTSFLIIIFALMAEQVRQADERQKVEKVAEIIRRSPEELHAHFTWIPYTLDERQQGIRVGEVAIAGSQLEAMLQNYHITLLRQGWGHEQDPAWWKGKLEAHNWKWESSSTHSPTKGVDEEHIYPPLEIRFHGTVPRDYRIKDKLEKVKLVLNYRVRGGEVYIGGTHFSRQQMAAILSQTKGLFIYLREGDEADPAWLQNLWRNHHFADFDKFEELWRR